MKVYRVRHSDKSGLANYDTGYTLYGEKQLNGYIDYLKTLYGESTANNARIDSCEEFKHQ